MNFLIQWMYGDKKFTTGGIIYDITYGFRKKYQCANEFWNLSLFSTTFKFVIDFVLIIMGMGEVILMVLMDLPKHIDSNSFHD